MTGRLIGVITATETDQTAVVTIEQHKIHRLYGKRYRQTKTVLAHNPKNIYQVGNLVSLGSSRPLSARKHWRILERLGSAAVKEVSPETVSQLAEGNQ